MSEGGDPHVHWRDLLALAAVAGFTADQMAWAFLMPNLQAPVTTTELALAYKERALAALTPAQRAKFTPYMTLYLTDNTSPEEIRKAKTAGIVAAKYYPAGATTNSDLGVSDITKTYRAIEAMQEVGMFLLLHGEVADPDVDDYDREAVFIDKKLAPLRREFPKQKMTLEHISTKQGAQYVMLDDEFIAATVTLQHLLYNRMALFAGGFQPHAFCRPILKKEEHRLALVRLVTSGKCHRVFMGTDSAPHAANLKEHAGGHAGCFTANAAMEQYTEVFDKEGALEQLEAFTSLNAPAFYGIPPSTRTITMGRVPWTMPEDYPFGQARIKPLRGGQTVQWQIEGLQYPELKAA